MPEVFKVEKVRVALAARFGERKVMIAASPVSGSPFELVDVSVDDGSWILVSDLREWEDRDGFLVGRHYEDGRDTDVQEAVTLEEAVALVEAMIA